jgi:hypothetical protein
MRLRAPSSCEVIHAQTNSSLQPTGLGTARDVFTGKPLRHERGVWYTGRSALSRQTFQNYLGKLGWVKRQAGKVPGTGAAPPKPLLTKPHLAEVATPQIAPSSRASGEPSKCHFPLPQASGRIQPLEASSGRVTRAASGWPELESNPV